jgi:MFS family permease
LIREFGLNKENEITKAKMIILGTGWYGFLFFWGMHTVAMPLFLRDFTQSKFVISLVLCLAGVAGSIVPPIAGYLSDRSSTRFGRRSPFIFLGALGVLVCVMSLPHLETFRLVAIAAGAMYFCLRTAETPYLSLLADITPPKQRSTASGIMNLIGSIGLISFFIVGSRIWEAFPSETFYLVGIVHFGLAFLAIFLLKEPQVPFEKSSAGAGALRYLKSFAEETNVLKFFIAQFFWWCGFWMVSAFAALFIVEELGAQQDKAYLVLMVFTLVAIAFMLPMGMLGDRFGRKGILTSMVAFWAVSEFIVGLSQNLTHAYVTVAFTAIPYAAVMVVALAYMFDLIPRERTAEFTGLSIISVAVAQIFGPVLGGWLIDAYGYRSIFPVTSGFMLVGLILLQFVRPRQELIPPTD